MADLYQPHTHTIGPGAGEELITVHDMGGLTESEIRQLINARLACCGDGTTLPPGITPPDGTLPGLPIDLEDEMITDTHFNVVPKDMMGAGFGVPGWKLELVKFTVPFPAEWGSAELLVNSSTNMHDSQYDHKNPDHEAAGLRPLTAIHSEILFDGVVLRNQLSGPADRGEDIFFVMSEQRTVTKTTDVIIQYKNSTQTAADMYINPTTHKADHLINLADDLQPVENSVSHLWIPNWDNWFAGFGSHNYTAGYYLLHRTS